MQNFFAIVIFLIVALRQQELFTIHCVTLRQDTFIQNFLNINGKKYPLKCDFLLNKKLSIIDYKSLKQNKITVYFFAFYALMRQIILTPCVSLFTHHGPILQPLHSGLITHDWTERIILRICTVHHLVLPICTARMYNEFHMIKVGSKALKSQLWHCDELRLFQAKDIA